MIVPLIVSIALAAAMADEAAPAAPAEAAPAATEGSAAAEAKPVDRDQEVVCKREAKTASRTPSKKICMTRAEWKAQDNRGGVVIDSQGRTR